MHPFLRMVPPALAAVLLGSACFDFDATMAGGPLGGDSGVTPRDGNVVDTTVADTSGPDAHADGGSTDATLDAGDGATQDSGSFVGDAHCASIARPEGGLFFCDDFDEHPLPGSWESWGEQLGTIVETDASAVSVPNSVDETTQRLASGQVIDVALRTVLPLPPVPSTLSFGFSVQPLQIDTTDNAAIVLGAIDFLDAAGYRYTVGLSITVANGQPAMTLAEQSGLAAGGNFPDGAPPSYTPHPLPPTDPLAMNAWSDIVIEVDWGTSTLEGKVTINGNEELDVPLTMTLVPSSLQIGIGTSFVTEYDGGLSPVWELRYDNVLFTSH